jgi:hypothetical protein
MQTSSMFSAHIEAANWVRRKIQQSSGLKYLSRLLIERLPSRSGVDKERDNFRRTQHRNEQKQTYCCVCRSHKILQYMFKECGHICACSPCLQEMCLQIEADAQDGLRCPMCRTESALRRVFISQH